MTRSYLPAKTLKPHIRNGKVAVAYDTQQREKAINIAWLTACKLHPASGALDITDIPPMSSQYDPLGQRGYIAIKVAQ